MQLILKSSRRFALIFVLIITLITATAAQAASHSWQNIGSPNFSAGMIGYTSMTIDSSGTPYVAYADWGNSIKATVMKFNGTSWVNVGSAGFSAGVARWQSLVLDSNDTPYLAYRDYGNGSRTTVMKFNGASWVPVGSVGFSSGVSSHQSLALDTNGIPYVAFRDAGNASKVTVMKFNGANWVNVGPAGFTPDQVLYTSLVLDSNNTPYVAFKDADNAWKVSVMKFNGASWELVGSAGFSAGAARNYSLSMVIDGSDTLYVAFQDESNSNKVTVMKFNGASWVNVGSAGFAAATDSMSKVYSLSLALDGSGAPFVSFSDAGNSSKATVMKFNGASWVNVGSAGFSAGGVDWASLALDGSGTPYVAFRVGTNKITVMAFAAPPIVLYGAYTTPADGAKLTRGPLQINIEFDQVVKSGNIDAGSAENTANYLLVEDGANGSFNTLSCLGGVVADDTPFTVDSVAYDGSGPSVATLNINGGVRLPIGSYRLFICGTTSIENLAGQELNDGLSDSTLDFTISPVFGEPEELPDTGFALGVVTRLSQQPPAKTYTELGDLWLEIPSLDVQMTIVGVGIVDGEWDVSWLGENAGWLQGTAFPTWEGNTGITGHVWNASNNPGPFANLRDLRYGDIVRIHAWGQVYTYEVQSNYKVLPGNTTPLQHEEYDWVTLLTCESYSEDEDGYLYRRAVRAVLVSIEDD
jgi:LPXTG-site transpeptidase (sortase) family protein